MKRNKIFKNIGRVYLAIGILTMTLLSSCLKDNSPGSVDFSKSPALVGFQYLGFGATPLLTKLFNQPNVTSNVEVTLSVASITLSSPVTVNVAVDDAGANAYTAANDGTHVLPAADYTIANAGAITIKPGQQIAKLLITFAGDKIDFTQNYVLGLKITSASGAIIATNLQSAILTITLQSVYEGEYVNTGSFNDVVSPGLNGQTYPENIDLLTVGSLVVDFYDLTYNYGYGHPIEGGSNLYGGFSPRFTFDSTGKIIAVTNHYGQGNNNRNGVLDPTGVNAAIGTPGTAGFKIQVKYIMHQINTGVDRTFFNETYTYIGPSK